MPGPGSWKPIFPRMKCLMNEKRGMTDNAPGGYARTTQDVINAAVPETLEIHPDGVSALTLKCRIEPDMVWFNGHFPGNPVYPGVAALDLVVRSLRHFFGFDSESFIMTIPQMKFPKPVFPGAALTLSVSWNAPDLKCAFQITETAESDHAGSPAVHASGKIIFLREL